MQLIHTYKKIKQHVEWTVQRFLIICFHTYRYMDRPRRIVSKPSRYITTSSSDEHPNPKKRSTAEETAPYGTMDQDFNDINGILSSEKNYLQFNTHEQTYNVTHPRTCTNTQPHTNILNTHTQKHNMTPRTCTITRPNTNILNTHTETHNMT